MTVNLKILSDIKCDVYIDNVFITTANKDQVEVIPLETGEYFLKCIGAYSPECKIEQILELISPKVIKVSFEKLIKSHPEWTRDSSFAYSSEKKSFFHVATGKDITSIEYEAGEEFMFGKALAQRDGRWGYIDNMGTEIVPCKYVDKLMMFKETLACRYNYIDDFYEGKAIVKSSDNLYGYINEDGVEVINCTFTECTSFNKGLAGVKKGGNWCFINEDGNEIGQIYDSISIYIEGFYKVRRGDKYGIVDSIGSEVLLCIYDKISDFKDDFAEIRKDNKYGLIDRNEFFIIPCEYDCEIDFIEEIAIVIRDGECGAINRKNQEVIPFKYGHISKFSNGIAYVRDHGRSIGVFDGGKYGIVDITGREIVPCKYDSIDKFTDGRAKVRYNGWNYGYIDLSGKEIITPQYAYIDKFIDGVAKVKKGNFYGYIDINGAEIIPCIYSKIYDFTEGFAKVEQGDKQGVVTSKGLEIVPCSYSYVNFSDGIAQVENNEGLCGIIDSKGNVIAPCIYDITIRAENRIGLIKDNTLPAYIDNRYKESPRLFSEMPNDAFETLWIHVSNQVESLIKDEFITYKTAYISNYIDGLAIVKVLVNKKQFYGIISHTHEFIMPCIYYDIVNINNELFRVQLGEAIGLVNKNGEEVVPCKYSWIDAFENDYAIVRVGRSLLTEKYGLIDSFGNECVPCQYDFIRKAGFNTYVVKLNGKFGIVNEHNKVLLDFKYDWVEEFKDGKAKVKVLKEQRWHWGKDVYHWGLIAEDGRELIPCICDEIVDFIDNTYKVRINKLLGLADRDGNTIISCKYEDEIIDYSDGIVTLKVYHSKYRLINQIPFKNVPISQHTEVLQGGKLIKVYRNGMFGCQDIDGNEIVPCIYNSIDDFVEGLAKAHGKDGYGYIDLTGNEVIPCQYNTIGAIVDGYAIISKIEGYNKCINPNSTIEYESPIIKYGIVNIKGEEIVRCIYDEVYLFEEERACIKKGEKWGFVNKNGSEVNAFEYDAVLPFKEGLAAVQIAGKWGFIDKRGWKVVPCRYDDVRSFKEGFACVRNIFSQEYWEGYDDETGFECGYDNLYKCGFIDKHGNEILPVIYDHVYDFNNGYAIVMQGNRYGIIDNFGLEVLPCKFGWIQEREENIFYNINGEDNYISKEVDLRLLNYYDACRLSSNNKFILVKKNGMWGMCSIECEVNN